MSIGPQLARSLALTPAGGARAPVKWAAAVLAAFLIAGCSGGGSPPTTHSSPAGPPHTADPASPALTDFSGPIVVRCHAAGVDFSVSKLNVDTGALTEIAHFPAITGPYGTACVVGMPADNGDKNLGGQTNRMLFSPDFTKYATTVQSSDMLPHVGYYDATQRATVDVTKLLMPAAPASNFGQPAERQDFGGVFDDSGLFVFWDEVGKVYDYFDTTSKKIARTSATPYTPRFMAAAHLGDIALDKGQYHLLFRTCGGLWAINDTKYLGVLTEQADLGRQNTYVGVEDISPTEPPPSVNPCEHEVGTRVTPPMDTFEGTAADPSGSTILFWLRDRVSSNHTLYRANMSDPQHPAEIKVAGTALGNANSTYLSIIGWQ